MIANLSWYVYCNNNPISYCDPSGYLSVKEANAQIVYWKTMYALGYANGDKKMMALASYSANEVRSQVTGNKTGLIAATQSIPELSNIKRITKEGVVVYKDASEIINDASNYMNKIYGRYSGSILAIAASLYLYYPGYGDINISYGTELGFGVTGGIMYDTQTGNFHAYIGGGLMTPSGSFSATVAPTTRQGVTTGWNWGYQINDKAALNAGKSLDTGSPFMEVGVATSGLSLTAYYVFEPFASTGDLALQYRLTYALAQYINFL